MAPTTRSQTRRQLAHLLSSPSTIFLVLESPKRERKLKRKREHTSPVAPAFSSITPVGKPIDENDDVSEFGDGGLGKALYPVDDITTHVTEVRANGEKHLLAREEAVERRRELEIEEENKRLERVKRGKYNRNRNRLYGPLTAAGRRRRAKKAAAIKREQELKGEREIKGEPAPYIWWGSRGNENGEEASPGERLRRGVLVEDEDENVNVVEENEEGEEARRRAQLLWDDGEKVDLYGASPRK